MVKIINLSHIRVPYLHLIIDYLDVNNYNLKDKQLVFEYIYTNFVVHIM